MVIGGIPLGIAFSDRLMEKRMVFLPFCHENQPYYWRPVLIVLKKGPGCSADF